MSDQIQPGQPSSPPLSPPEPKRLCVDDLQALNDELAAMARAGLPIDRSLEMMAGELGSSRLKSVTLAIAEDLRAGKTLPEAFAARRSTFPPYYASLLAAGIRSGKLGEVLATMTRYARTTAELRSSAISAIFYPATIFVVSAAMIVAWFLFVVPSFEKIFADFRLRMPWATTVVLAIGRHPLLYLVAPVAGVIAMFFVVRAVMTRLPHGHRVWARFVYGVPMVGTLLKNARLAAFTDLLGILVRNAVPLPEALELAGEASADPTLIQGARLIAGDVARGTPFGEALRRGSLLPGYLRWMLALGDRQGRLGEVLDGAASTYRLKTERQITLFRNVFPTFLLVGVAALVLGLVAIVLFLPMLQLLTGLSGGM